jgi:hypothetical protein
MSEKKLATEVVPRVAIIILAILALIGSIKVISVIFRLFSFFYRHFMRSGYQLHKRYYGNNTWAIITGGTDGLGL